MKSEKAAVEAPMEVENDNKESRKTCGIIMPISNHPDYPAEHWNEVCNILAEVISETEFVPNLVSNDDAIGLIHERIVTNIYNNEMAVCDVSSKNPNVMFELGLRLAFDKPTIIIKDDKTDYSFDTGVIEHITYPSSLRFSQILKFKEDLKKRIIATFSKSQSEADYSPFLKSFGKTIKPATLQEKQVSVLEYILEGLEVVKKDIKQMRSEQKRNDIKINDVRLPLDQVYKSGHFGMDLNQSSSVLSAFDLFRESEGGIIKGITPTIKSVLDSDNILKDVSWKNNITNANDIQSE